MSAVTENASAYDPKPVETAAQAYWDSTRAFEVDESSDKPKQRKRSINAGPGVALPPS